MTARKRKPWSPADLQTPNLPHADRPVGWDSEAVKLVGVYNRCVVRVNETRIRKAVIRRPTDATREVVHGLSRWCEVQGVDPVSWIYAVFAALSWRLPPGQKQLFSRGYRKTYDKLNAVDGGTVAGMLATSAAKFVPGGVELSYGGEAAKRRYAERQQPAMCLLAYDVTLGFHGSSPTCASCPLAQACSRSTQARRAA